MAYNKSKAVAPETLEDVIASDTTEKKLNLKDVSRAPVHIDDYAIINVKSNVFGELIYIDKKTSEETRWEKCGTVQQMTFASLRNMKASSISFFKNQWVIITGFADENADIYTTADIYRALFIVDYYKNLIDPSDYEVICKMSPSEIKERISYMSSEAKTNLIVALNTYIEKGILDSLKTIKAFEEALGCELGRPE